MSKVFSKLLALAICLVLSFGTLPAFAGVVPPERQNENNVWIEPETISFSTADVDVGYKFNVTVWAFFKEGADYDYIGAWQAVVAYEKTLLKATRAGYTEGTISQWFKEVGMTTMPVTPAIDESLNATHNYVLYGESYLSGPKAPEGTGGSLFWIEFEVVSAPGKGESIASSIGFVTVGTPKCKLLDEAGTDRTDDFTWYPASYSFVWAVPPSPYLAVDPTYREYGPYPPSVVGTTFTEDVYIMELSSAWYIVNASFDLTYDSSFLEVVDVTLNTADWDVAAIADYSTPGVISFYVETSQVLGGDVLVGTITFNITDQGSYPTVYESPLAFENVELKDHTLDIPTAPPVEGEVKVIGLLTLPLPWLEIVFSDTGTNEITLGPEPVVGKEFTAEIWIKNLHFAWYLVGLQYRISYCPDFLEVVRVTEGPYLPSFNQTPTEPYTFFVSYIEEDGLYGPHILVGEMILPNETGQWPAPLPGDEPPEDGLIGLIRFKVKYQDISFTPENLTCFLEFIETKLIDVNGATIPTDVPVNGTVNVLGSKATGKFIDVYTDYPDGFNGKGFNMSSDMYWPQKEVVLHALVTYNSWPLQNKLVTFTVFDPQGNVWTQLEAFTDKDGIATVSFRLPWPCDNPEDLFGVWKVKADVDIACEVIIDYLYFHYDYLVNIISVETDEYYYKHCETITVTVTLTSHAQQNYAIGIRAVLHDELNVPISVDQETITIGGATFCTAEEYTVTFTLHVEKFAVAGWGTIHVVPRLKWQGEWVAAGPEATAMVYILPE